MVLDPYKILQANGYDDLHVVEHDVKICDICENIGHENLLAICHRCIDGTEHI